MGTRASVWVSCTAITAVVYDLTFTALLPSHSLRLADIYGRESPTLFHPAAEISFTSCGRVFESSVSVLKTQASEAAPPIPHPEGVFANEAPDTACSRSDTKPILVSLAQEYID
jgi:hypothetical protein